MRKKLIVLLTVLILTLSFCETNPTRLVTGEKLPSFNLMSLSNKNISTSTLKYPLIVSVFTTWCTYCKVELPVLNKIYQEAKAKKLMLNVIGVDAGVSATKVASFQRKLKLDFEILLDTKMDLTQQLQINGVPVIMIFNKKGQLAYQGNGIPENWQKLLN